MFSEEPEIIELYGVDRTRSDAISAISDIYSSTYYEANLYFDKIIETYNRRYMKSQELIANIGGLLKGIIFIFTLFISFYNKYYGNLALVNDIFIYDSKNNNLYNDLNNFTNKKIIIDTIQCNTTNKKSIFNKNNYNQIHNDLGTNTLMRATLKKNQNIISPKNRNNNGLNIIVNHKDKIYISLSKYLIMSMCSKLKKNDSNVIKDYVNKGFDVIKKRLDISYILCFMNFIENSLSKEENLENLFKSNIKLKMNEKLKNDLNINT